MNGILDYAVTVVPALGVFLAGTVVLAAVLILTGKFHSRHIAFFSGVGAPDFSLSFWHFDKV
jgi:hypothetical protein